MAKTKKGLFSNPIIEAQSKAEIPFVKCTKLGHTMPKGKEFLGEKEFISIQDIIKKIKQSCC